MELNVVTPFKIELKNSRNNLLNDNVQEIQDNAAYPNQENKISRSSMHSLFCKGEYMIYRDTGSGRPKEPKTNIPSAKALTYSLFLSYKSIKEGFGIIKRRKKKAKI